MSIAPYHRLPKDVMKDRDSRILMWHRRGLDKLTLELRFGMTNKAINKAIERAAREEAV